MQNNLDSRMIDLAIRLGFVAAFIFAALSMVAPLAGLMLWSVILTVAIYPVFAWLARLLGGRETLAAVIITVLGLAIALGPIALLVGSAVEAGLLIERRLTSGEGLIPAPPDRLLSWPIVGGPLHGAWDDVRENFRSDLSAHSEALLSASGTVLGRLARYGLDLLIMAASVVIMGLMFRPGAALAREARKFANRVFTPHGGHMVDLSAATVRNVSQGIVGVAIIQGLLTGVLLISFGIKGAGLIALVGIFLSIIQVGPWVVLVPTALWAWTAMPPGQAALLTVLILPLMIVDDLLKPVFMGRGMKTPMLVILIGVLGGIASHGLLGLFAGPVILAVFYEMFLSWVDQGAEDGVAEDDPMANSAEEPADPVPPPLPSGSASAGE